MATEYFGNVVCSIRHGKKINTFPKISTLWLKEAPSHSYRFLKNLAHIFFLETFSSRLYSLSLLLLISLYPPKSSLFIKSIVYWRQTAAISNKIINPINLFQNHKKPRHWWQRNILVMLYVVFVMEKKSIHFPRYPHYG